MVGNQNIPVALRIEDNHVASATRAPSVADARVVLSMIDFDSFVGAALILQDELQRKISSRWWRQL